MRFETSRTPPAGPSRERSKTAGLPATSLASTIAAAADAGPLTRRTNDEQARALAQAIVDLLTPRVRCRRCGHELYAEKSQRLGIGPECRRREAAVLRVIA